MARRFQFPNIAAMKANTPNFNGDMVWVNDDHDPFRYDSSVTVFDEIINYEATGIGTGAFVRQIDRYSIVNIDNTDSPYQAKINEFIKADSLAAEVRVNTPIVAQAGDRFVIKKISDVNINQVIVDAAISGSLVESRLSHTVINEVILVSEGEVWVLVYDGTNWLIKSVALTSSYLELWDATPIVDILDTAETIQWTFVPIFPGQTPSLVSHASGIFTSNGDEPINLKVSCVWGYLIDINNRDAKGLLTDVITGAGTSFFNDIVSSFTSPRSSVTPFPNSQNDTGIWSPEVSDTLKFDVSSDVLQTGQTDLLGANLFLTLG